MVVSSRKQANVDKGVQQLRNNGVADVIGVACHVGKKEDRQKLIQTVGVKYLTNTPISHRGPD